MAELDSKRGSWRKAELSLIICHFFEQRLPTQGIGEIF
jgi:hypothetical protein